MPAVLLFAQAAVALYPLAADLLALIEPMLREHRGPTAAEWALVLPQDDAAHTAVQGS